MITSAGLALIRKGTILLGHPTNAPWKGQYSIPKGNVNEGEDLIDAAIRETKEEIGIVIRKSDVQKTPHLIEYKKTPQLSAYKRVYYFIADVSAYYSIPDIIPKNMIQLEEVDYAKFFTKQEAKSLIFHRQLEILQYVK